MSTAWLFLLGGALLVAVWWWRRRRRARDGALPGAAQATGEWRVMSDRVAALKKSLTAANPSVARVILAYEPLGDEAVLGVHRRHQGNIDRLGALDGRLEAAMQTLGATDQDESASQLESMSNEVAALEAYVKEMDAEAAHAEMLTERAGILAVEAREALAQSAAALVSLSAELDRDADQEPLFPSSEALLAVATAAADGAEDWLAAGNRLAAGRSAEEAAEMARRLETIASDWRALRTRVIESSDLYRHLDGFAPESWADVSGNGHEAEESLDTVPAMLHRLAGTATGGGSGRAFGKDTSAGFLASLEAVEAELARGNRLLDGVADRLARIETDRDRATPALDSARADLERARIHLADPKVDAAVGAGPTDTLDQATAALDEAQGEIATALPDWPGVVALVERATRLTSQALADAKLEMERLASARRLVDSSAKTAESAVARADGFMSVHARDLGSAHLPKLQRARDALDEGEARRRAADQLQDEQAIAGLAAAQSQLEEAARLANEAYEAMAADFARLESRRTEYVPRPDWMSPTVPVPVDIRPKLFPSGQRGWRDVSAPRRPSSWGSRPSSGTGGGSRDSSGSRPSSSRRGGGRGW
jgi:chromosome segregation ATPase